MILKLMGGEDLPDSDSRKTFLIFAGVTSVDFDRDEDTSRATAYVTFESGDPESYQLDGNAYLMTDDGAFVTAFGCAPVPELLAAEKEWIRKNTARRSRSRSRSRGKPKMVPAAG
jgi:hypothetical protein